MKYSRSKLKYWISFFLIGILSFASNVYAATHEIKNADEWNKYANDMVGSSILRGDDYYIIDDLDFEGKDFMPFGGFTKVAGRYSLSPSAAFSGTINGNGFKLKNISEFSYVNKMTTGQYASIGILGVSKGEIRNLIVDNMQMPQTGTAFLNSKYVGGICGYQTGGSITGCAVVNSTLFAATAPMGGIVGCDNGGTIGFCAVNNTVLTNPATKETTIGGIVGFINAPTSVDGCYVNATFQDVQSSTGGIVGKVYYSKDNITVISNCFAQGSFVFDEAGSSSLSSNGGIVGYAKNTSLENCGSAIDMTVNLSAFSGEKSLQQTAGAFGFLETVSLLEDIKYCYATGKIKFSDKRGSNKMSGINAFVGAVTTGKADYKVNDNCYSVEENYKYLVDGDYVRSDGDVVYGAPGTLKSQEFVQSGCLAIQLNKDQGVEGSHSIWVQNNKYFDKYPVPFGLTKELTDVLAQIGVIGSMSDILYTEPTCGTVEPEQTVYHIKTAADLADFAKLMNADDHDADWSADKTVIIDNDITTAVTTVIGTAAKPFKGTFQGGSYMINLAIKSTSDNVGLIGYADGKAKITDVQVKGSVSGANYVGAVVGRATASVTISGCGNGAVVSGSKSYVGGIVGSSAGTVSSCLNVANVSGSTNVGGIAGTATSLTDCANMGYIKGEATSTAGVVGSSTGKLTRCLNAGYTQGAGISNGGSYVDCYFDFALSINGQLQANQVTMTSTKVLSLDGWTNAKGAYPIPSVFDGTDLGELATQPIYFTNNNKANAIEDSIAAGSSWKSSDSKILSYNKGGFLLMKAGSVTLSISNGVATRTIPVNVLNEKRFSGGYGHFLAPYQISKLADLTELKTFVSNTHGAKGYMFELTNDIEGTFETFIGASTDHFKGDFHSTVGKIYNINVDITAKSDIPVGLFGVVDGVVEGVSVSGSVEIAGTGKMAYAGGIAGYCEGRISGCVNNAEITAIKGSLATIGGICGGTSGSVTHCTNIARVTGNAKASGITNVDEVSAAHVAQNFNAGVVSSDVAAGVSVVLSTSPSVKPTFSDNINVAAVNGTSASDALIYYNGANPIITGGIYDNQHAVAKTTNATAKADSSSALVLETVEGFTSASGVYPTNGSSAVNTLASLPVIVNYKDSANNIKHDFKLVTATGVEWKSLKGNVKINGTKVERVSAGKDTLVATLGKYSRRVPVVIACVWDTVNDPDVEVCNMYGGKTYKKDTTIVVKEVTDNTNPNADCGTLHIKKIIITVGETGAPITLTGCGSKEYDGVVYKKDTTFTNKNCDVVSISIYPLPSTVDSVVKLDSKTTSYTYTASDGKAYTIKRSSKPITDSLIVRDVIKSKTCSCDSLIRRVLVSIPTYETTVVVDDVKCNTYEYKTFSGKTVTLGWPLNTRDPEENYWQAKVIDVTYNDTNFTSATDYSEIRVVKVKIFKSLYLTDTMEHVGVDCSPITIPLSDGTEVTYSGTKDTIFYDKLMSDVYEGCPQSVTKIKLRLKGLSEVKDTLFVGKIGAPRCTDCADVVILENVQDGSLANVGFCDKVRYKQYASDSRVLTRTASARTPVDLEFDADENTCGYRVPVKFRINVSDTKDSAFSACDSVKFVTRTGRTFMVKNDTVIADTLKGAVPGCGCDSIFKTKITVYKPTRVKFDTVACGVAIFKYLDKSKGSITLKNDTMIIDTVKKFNMECDSIIRTSTYTIHKVYPKEVNTLVEAEACQEYTYSSPIKGAIVCKNDTLFNDSLKTIYGCDSIIPVKITINKPVVIDSVLHICSTFVYRYRKGGTVTLPLGDNPAIVDTFTIFDSFKNVDPSKCDTTFRMLVYSHIARVVQPKVTPVCNYKEYTRFNGERFEITESTTVYDTLKSQMCDCDSIIHIDSFSVGKPYYPTAETTLDTTLFGCRTNTVLTYERKVNAWNTARSISFVPVSSEIANQAGFLNIVRISNPTVVALDTVVEKIYGNNVRRYYWLAHDTMKTVAGCDSVVPFRVEYDGQHTLGRKFFYVNYKQAPFVYDGVTYNMPEYERGPVSYDSVEVVLPSRTGGCDTTYYAMIKMYPCKIIDTTVHYCDEAQFTNLHRQWVTFTNDTVYSDTIRYEINNDTASCDKMIKIWHVKVGHKTPASQIATVYVGGCDNVTFRRNGVASNMQAQDTVFYESGIFRCRYINASGCDSVVPVNLNVHKVEENTVVLRRTDYYIYKSPLDGSRTRVTSDTVIEERVPDMVTVTMANGQSYTCDSLITTQITIRPAEWVDTTIVGCDSVIAIAPADSIRGGFDAMPTKWYKRDTTFDIPNSQTFDPYYHVHIKLNRSTYGKRVIDSCRQVTYKGTVYTQSVKFVEQTTTVAGCDSVDTVVIVVRPVIEKENTTTGCGYLIYDSKVYTQDTTLYDTVRYNSCNCDSIITSINVVIYEPTVEEKVIDSCMFFTYPKMVAKEYNWFVRDSVYEPIALDSVYTASTSFYRFAEEDKNGCNTIQHLSLNVNPCYPYPVIVNKYNWILALNKDLLTKDVHAGRITGYQWYKNGELLLGANQSYYTEDQPLEGCYQVQVKFGNIYVESENVCIDPSLNVALAYDLYPDPVTVGGMVSIKCNFDLEDTVVEMYNTLGVRVYSGTLTSEKDTPVQIPYRLAAAGNYFLKLVTEDGTVLGKKFICK